MEEIKKIIKFKEEDTKKLDTESENEITTEKKIYHRKKKYIN